MHEINHHCIRQIPKNEQFCLLYEMQYYCFIKKFYNKVSY